MMPQEKQTHYREWQFTPEELLAAQAIPGVTYQYYQTSLSELAAQRAVLAFDPGVPTEEVIRTAEFIRGQMSIFEQLLMEADQANETLTALYGPDSQGEEPSPPPSFNPFDSTQN